MKKTILLLCLNWLAGSPLVKAQTPVMFGVNAGPNFSYLYNVTQGFKSTGKVGANVNFVVRIGNRLYFEPDLCMNFLRSKLMTGTDEHKLNFITLQLPLLVGYKIISKPGFNLRAAIGPEAELNVKKPAYFNGGDYKTITSGGRVMVGIDIHRFILDAGLSSVFDKLEKYSDQKMNAFSLGVGFKL